MITSEIKAWALEITAAWAGYGYPMAFDMKDFVMHIPMWATLR